MSELNETAKPVAWRWECRLDFIVGDDGEPIWNWKAAITEKHPLGGPDRPLVAGIRNIQPLYASLPVPVQGGEGERNRLSVLVADMSEDARADSMALRAAEAEVASLRQRLEAVRAETIEQCAKVVENMPIMIGRDQGIGSAGRSHKPANFDDAASAIRALTDPLPAHETNA